jgi:putative endonuclease
MTAPDRAALGRGAEDLAAAHLQAAGARIVLRNFRRRRGELDIVALHHDTLLVVEVRLRSSDEFGGSAASVDHRKQRRIASTTRQLLQLHRELARHPVRFDVIAISRRARDRAGDACEIEWIRHAFEMRG